MLARIGSARARLVVNPCVRVELLSAKSDSSPLKWNGHEQMTLPSSHKFSRFPQVLAPSSFESFRPWRMWSSTRILLQRFLPLLMTRIAKIQLQYSNCTELTLFSFFHVMSWFYLPRQEWRHSLLGLAVARDFDEVGGAATI